MACEGNEEGKDNEVAVPQPVGEPVAAKESQEAPADVVQVKSSLKGKFGSRSQSKLSDLGGSPLEPHFWERFLAGDCPTCFGGTGYIVMLLTTLLFMVLGLSQAGLSDSFGIFVKRDSLTQVMLAHMKINNEPGMYDYTPEGVTVQFEIPPRFIPIDLVSIVYEAVGTNCPGENCDLKKANLLTSSTFERIRDIEQKMWTDSELQSKYCALTKSSTGDKCTPPFSLLQLLYWGENSGYSSLKLLPEVGWSSYQNCRCNTDLVQENSCAGCNSGLCNSCSNWQEIGSEECNQVLLQQTNDTDCASLAKCSLVSPMEYRTPSLSHCAARAWSYVAEGSGASLTGDTRSIYSKLCSDSSYYAGLREKIIPKFSCDDVGNGEYFIEKHGTPFLRTYIQFGMPVKKATTELDFMEELDILKDDFAAHYYKLMSEVTQEANANSEQDKFMVYMGSMFTEGEEQNAITQQDSSLTLVSVLFVFLYMWFTVESFFLAGMGMLQIIFSIGPTFLLWKLIDPNGIGGLQMLTIFMILGIGADDVFVLMDAWKQAKHELADQGDTNVLDIFVLSYRRAFSAMLTTTATTACGLLLGVTNPVPFIADFCVFACIIIIFDFVWCVTFFAASVPFFERYMHGHCILCCGRPATPGTCGQPGCCWGCTRIVWRKMSKTPAEDTTNERFFERLFAGPLYNFIYRFKLPLVIFWVTLFVAAVIAAAVGTKLADTDPAGFAPDHPIQRRTDLQKYFTKDVPNVVNIVWGLAEYPVQKWKTNTEAETVEFGSSIDNAIDKAGQSDILNLCQAPDTEANLRCSSLDCIVKGKAGTCATKSVMPDPEADGFTYKNSDGVDYTYSVPVDPLCQVGRYCIMEQVATFADFNNMAFPVDNLAATLKSPEFATYIRGYLKALEKAKAHWHAENWESNTGVIFEGDKLKYMYVSFNATFEGMFLPIEEGQKIYDDWDSFVQKYASNTNAVHVTMMYLFKVLQEELVVSAFQNIGLSLLVAGVALSLVTWNWYISLLGLFCIITIMTLLLGFFPVLQWELDIFNVIFLIMSVGLSVDYVVHLLHAFNESESESREERTKDAMSTMGITVLSGAITTLLAAIPLFNCQTTFFSRFGAFVFIIIALSISIAIFMLVPLLLLLGPKGHFGDITPFYKLSAYLRSKKSKETSDASPREVSDETGNVG